MSGQEGGLPTGLLAVIPVFGAVTAVGAGWPGWLMWGLVLLAIGCVGYEFLRWWLGRAR